MEVWNQGNVLNDTTGHNSGNRIMFFGPLRRWRCLRLSGKIYKEVWHLYLFFAITGLDQNKIKESSMQVLFRLAVLSIVLLAFSNLCFAETESGDSSSQKAVLVTGASTGIGRKITEVLAAKGYFVYAGARKQKDLDALNEIENVQSIRLDVTIQDEIDAAVKTVRDGGRGLYGLVNNAGVGIGGPLIEVSEDDVQWLFDVNVFGVFRVTQAFAPLIIGPSATCVSLKLNPGIPVARRLCW